ncbi:MAG: transglycosylase domain-containing protein, partial [Alphaproteobacteria bacterium]
MLKVFGVLLVLLLLLVLGAGGGGLYLLYRFGGELPDYQQLAVYEPPTVTRVHAGDGRLLAEYAVEKRVFVPVSATPRRVIEAFLSAEDKNFYVHPGVDVVGVARALITNLRSMGDDRRPVGGSTITQQVAKNFLLSSEVSLERKIKEAILAFRIERTLTKDRILELYLNEIYLGFGSYGVAAAALNYFDKSLDELTLEESAYLAALPKAPNNYHPLRRHEAA